MVVGKKFVLKKHFVGEPKPSDVELVDLVVPPIENGGKCIYVTVAMSHTCQYKYMKLLVLC